MPSSNLEASKEELVNSVKGDTPHVVLLGAGASRATCPNGDKNNKKLPLMTDLVECLDLAPKLKKWNINPNQNFENIFSELYENKQLEKMKELENIIHNYFTKLQLPDNPTIYDHLVLSLRDKDFIASFNWDPLLLQAYARNSNKGIELPRLAFLHGNVLMGFCEKDKRINYLSEKCELCTKTLKPVPLLYPIKNKNYSKNEVIKSNWDRLALHLDNAFILTIFGYSGPKIDRGAITLIKKHWTTKRFLDDTNFITIQNDDQVYNHWKSFISSHHFEICDDFYKSKLANYPRRTLEQSWENNAQARFTEENPIPINFNFQKLWCWCNKFTKAEKAFRMKNPFPPPPKWYAERIT